MALVGLSSQNPSFSPQDLPGLTMWLDAADSNTMTLSGSNVSQWNDKSGNGNHGTQSTTSQQPTYASNALSFVASSSTVMALPNNTIPSGNSEYSVFVVLKPLTTGLSVFLFSGNAATNEANGFFSGATNGTQFQNYWFTNAVTGGSFTSGTRVLIEFTYAQNSFAYIYQNGALQASNALANRNSGTGNNYIGGEVGRGIYSTCELNEIVIYRTNLRDTARQQVEGYLSQKWGLTTPVGTHPFRYGPAMVLPTDIPGCRMWLDAADSTTLTLSGSNVTQWRDKSGRGYILTVPSGRTSPTYSNGVLTTTGSNALWSTTNFEISGNAQVTMFLVYSTTTTTGNLGPGAYIGSANSATPPTFFGIGTYQTTSNAIIFAASVFEPDVYITLTPNTGGARMMACGFYTGSQINGTYNGTLLTPQTLTTANFSAQPFQIGLRTANNSPSVDGTICECICYNTALTTTQRQQLEGYLAWKWGIQTTLPTIQPVLPASHPYRSSVVATRAFSPLDVDGLTFWVDATDSTTLTLSGSNVTQWRDKAAGIVMATQGTLANITRTDSGINGRPSVYLNNSVSNAVYLAGTLPNQLTGTAFYVFKAYSQRTVDWRPLVSWFGAATFPAYGYIGATTVDTVGVYTAYGGNGTPTQVLTAGSNYIISYAWSGTSTAVTTNGSAPQTGSQPGYSGTSTAFQIGENGTTLEYGEVLFFNSVLSTTQRQQVEGYLAEKWGLRASMGGVPHPFRYGPAMVLPTQISGCSLWLDAADSTTMTLSGSNVSQWRDKSGNGRHATGTVAPTYDATTRNVLFNGSSQYFTLPNGTYPVGNTPYSIFVVAYTRNAANPQWVLAGGSEVTNQAIGLLFYTTNAVWHSWWSNEYRVDNSIANNTPAIVNISYSTNRSIIINGGTASVNSPGAVRANPNTSNYIGRRAGDASQFFDGGMAECIIFTSELPTTQRQQIEGYLAWKWGLQASLPSSTTPWLTLKRSLSPVFTPNQIPGCTLWLDAADRTTLTLSGSNVTTWADKSGSGYTASPVGTVTTTTQNGNTVMDLASNGYFSVSPNYPWRSYSTTFFVARRDFTITHGATLNDFSNYISTPNWELALIGTFYGGGGQIHFRDSVNGQGVSVAPSNAYYIMSWGYGGGTAPSVYAINGTTRATTVVQGSARGDSTVTAPLLLNGSAYGSYGAMQLCEVLMYNSVLTAAQVRQVEGYLAEKWGLRASLGGTAHPFRYGPAMVLPTQISGCSLWLDAADVNATGSNPVGSSITSWKDKSSSGITLTSSVARTLSSNSLNGLPGVVFANDGGGGGFRATLTNTVSSPPLLIVAVCSYTASSNPAATNMIISCTGSDMNVCKATSNLQVYNTSGTIRSPNTLPTGPHIVSVICDNSVGGIWRNGALEIQGSSGTGTQFSGTVGVGCYAGGNDSPWSGSLHEIVVIPANGTVQRQQIEGYLAWKWGLQTSLPTPSHPYRSFKP